MRCWNGGRIKKTGKSIKNNFKMKLIRRANIVRLSRSWSISGFVSGSRFMSVPWPWYWSYSRSWSGDVFWSMSGSRSVERSWSRSW